MQRVWRRCKRGSWPDAWIKGWPAALHGVYPGLRPAFVLSQWPGAHRALRLWHRRRVPFPALSLRRLPPPPPHGPFGAMPQKPGLSVQLSPQARIHIHAGGVKRRLCNVVCTRYLAMGLLSPCCRWPSPPGGTWPTCGPEPPRQVTKHVWGEGSRGRWDREATTVSMIGRAGAGAPPSTAGADQTLHRSRWFVLSSRPTVSLLLVSRKSS